MDINIERSTFVFFDEKQKAEIAFFFDIEQSKLLNWNDGLVAHLALNANYIAVVQPDVKPNTLVPCGVKVIGIEWFYDVGYARNKLWQFWLEKTDCTTFNEMRASGDQEWNKFEWTGLNSGDGMNYQIVDYEDWIIVTKCTTLRGKVIKFGQSLKYVGKQSLSQNSTGARMAQHNDVMYLRVGDYGIDRYIIARQLHDRKAVGIQTCYHQATHLYTFIEALQIMQIQKTPMVATKNLKPGDSIASYVKNLRTSKFHAIFIDMLAEALDTFQEGGIYITTDADIEKTKSVALNMKYTDIDTFLRFSHDLLALLRKNGRTMNVTKIDGFTHDEFNVFCRYMVAQTTIELSGENIRLLH